MTPKTVPFAQDSHHVAQARDSGIAIVAECVYIDVECEPSLPDPKHVLDHRAALASKVEYQRWADECYIHEEGKVLPLLASPYDDELGQRDDLLQTIRSHKRLLVLGVLALEQFTRLGHSGLVRPGHKT